MICHIALPNAQYGHLMPPEDAVEYRSDVFAVADGITRDPIFTGDLRGMSLEEILAFYPNPSGARFAADTFCESFLKRGSENASADEIKKRFLEANAEIKKMNDEHVPHVDYLVNDYWACVASGAVISGKTLFWGVIGDCGVMVFSRTGDVKLASPNPMALFERFVADRKIQFRWETPEGRKLVRSQYRNQPTQVIDGVCASYGALTGEGAAESFIHTGSLELAEGDLVLVYSDGFEPTLKHPDFFKTVYDRSTSVVEQKLVPFTLGLAKADPEKYGKEKSLLALIV